MPDPTAPPVSGLVLVDAELASDPPPTPERRACLLASRRRGRGPAKALRVVDPSEGVARALSASFDPVSSPDGFDRIVAFDRDGSEIAAVELTPRFYRGVARAALGASDAVAGDVVPLDAGPRSPVGLFVVREDLESFLAAEAPIEIARALRLAEDEIRDPALQALDHAQLEDEFEGLWIADAAASRVDSVMSHLPGRIAVDPRARDVVALWVRRDDRGGVQGRALAASAIGHGVAQPEFLLKAALDGAPPRSQESGFVFHGAEGVAYLHRVFGPGEERKLFVDAQAVKAFVATEPSPKARLGHVAAIAAVVSRSNDIALERDLRSFGTLAPSRSGFTRDSVTAWCLGQSQ